MSEELAEDVPAAFWNAAEPQTVVRIHQLYEAAGAQVLITNTFQASAPALKRDEIEASVAEVNRRAVDNARAARPQCLLGSMGPCGIDWFAEDSPEFRAARAAYRGQAHDLLNDGVDGILLETFTSIRDVQPALAGVGDAAGGMPIFAEKHGAAATGVNCCSLSAADQAAPRLVAAAKGPVMVRPNAGDPHVIDGIPVWSEAPEAFAAACTRWKRAGIALVGSCCGTTAATTAAMAEALGVFEA